MIRLALGAPPTSLLLRQTAHLGPAAGLGCCMGAVAYILAGHALLPLGLLRQATSPLLTGLLAFGILTVALVAGSLASLQVLRANAAELLRTP